MSAAKSGTDEEVDGAPEKAAHVVNGDDDTKEPSVRVMKGVEEIRICDQATKNTLIPTKTARVCSAIC
jgi:hypothetical protein